MRVSRVKVTRRGQVLDILPKKIGTDMPNLHACYHCHAIDTMEETACLIQQGYLEFDFHITIADCRNCGNVQAFAHYVVEDIEGNVQDE